MYSKCQQATETVQSCLKWLRWAVYVVKAVVGTIWRYQAREEGTDRGRCERRCGYIQVRYTPLASRGGSKQARCAFDVTPVGQVWGGGNRDVRPLAPISTTLPMTCYHFLLPDTSVLHLFPPPSLSDTGVVPPWPLPLSTEADRSTRPGVYGEWCNTSA